MLGVRRTTAVAVVLSGLLLGTAPPLHADDLYKDCDKRIHKAEKKLGKAIEKHGEDSADAEARRRELDDIRRDCHETEHELRKEEKHEEHERQEELEHEQHEQHEEMEHGY